MGCGTSHHPDLELLLCFISAKKHRRPYDGKHGDHERRWPTGNGSVASPFPKQLEWVTRTTWRVRTAMNQSHADLHQGENAFGRACAKLRKSMGLTQREMGRLLGINGQAVGQWERGKRSPTVEHLKRLLALGIERHAFTLGQEHEEAHHLWLAA